MRHHFIINARSLIIFAFALLPSSITAQQPPPSFPQQGHPVVIREFIRGQKGDFSYHPRPSGDVNRDGILDIAPRFGAFNAGIIQGGDLSTMYGFTGLDFDGLGSSGNYRATILEGIALKAGNAVHGFPITSVGHGFNRRPIVGFWDLDTKQQVARLPLPVPPNPGLPTIDVIEQIWQVGDLDGDDYDELLIGMGAVFTGGFATVGLVDGATKTWRWVDYYPTGDPSASYISTMINTWPDPCQDINGDGVKDVIYAFPVGSPLAPNDWHTRCVSGLDGSEIWVDVRTAWGSTWDAITSVIGDVNQDGIRDLVQASSPLFSGPNLLHTGAVRVLSGFDGSLIWERDMVSYDPAPVAGVASTFVFHSFMDVTGDVNLDGVRDISTHAYIGDSFWPDSYEVWILSGLDGTVLSKESGHEIGYPWIAGVTGDGRFPVGDIDGDGWAESAMNFQDAYSSYDDLMITGRTTLYHPDTVQSGSPITFRLHIPTGANKGFKLLLSTGFHPLDEGFHFGTWNTHLLPSAILKASRLSPDTDGTLNQHGIGEVTIHIPARLNLVGQELFAVAIVKDSSRPSGILTKSSMGVLTVLP